MKGCGRRLLHAVYARRSAPEQRSPTAVRQHGRLPAPSHLPLALAELRLALLPDGRRFISGLGDATARIVEHGLAPQPALK